MYEYTEIEIMEHVQYAMEERPEGVVSEEWLYRIPLTYWLQRCGSWGADKVPIHRAEISKIPSSKDGGEIFVEILDDEQNILDSEVFYIDDVISGIVEIGTYVLREFYEIINYKP